MNCFIEKVEKNKTPFLQDYENDIQDYYEDKKNKTPFDILLDSYIEGTPLSGIDKMFKFQSEIDLKYKNRFRSKKQFRRFLDLSEEYFKFNQIIII